MKTQVEHLSLWQLFLLILAFETGSAVVVGIGNPARQDAWIAILIAACIGLVMVWIYNRILTAHPGDHLFQIFENVLGRAGAVVLTMLYSIYFLYSGARVLRDFGELIVTAILVDTPLEVITLVMMLVIVYILYLGIEVLARTCEIFGPYLFGFLLLAGILMLTSGSMEFNRLQPVLGEGVMPIINAVFPALLGFPFGEVIAFMLIIPQVNRIPYAGKVSLYALGASGLLLTITSMFQIAMMGVDAKNRSNFPLLSAVREVSVANFLERFDALVVFIVMLGIVIKVSIFFYAGLKGIEHVFQRPYRKFLLPGAILVSSGSILVAGDFSEHIQEGLQFVPMYVHMPLQYVVPIFLMVCISLKRRLSR